MRRNLIILVVVAALATLLSCSTALADDLAWRPLTLPDGMTDDIYSADFVTYKIGWVVGANGVILRTTNGGRSWITQDAETTESFRAIDAVTSNIALIVGDNGSTFYTDNAGDKWYPQGAGDTTQNFTDIAMANGKVGYAVGGDGADFRHTIDGGWFWQTATAPAVKWWSGVAATSVGTYNAWVCGPGGAITTTVDQGATWLAPETVGTADLYDIDTYKDLQQYAVGVGGAIAHRTGPAGTWGTQTSGTTENLFAVDTVGATAWAVGANGTIVRTSNSGVNWATQTQTLAPPTGMLHDVSAVDRSTAWLVGDGGQVYFTGTAGVPDMKRPVTKATAAASAAYHGTAALRFRVNDVGSYRAVVVIKIKTTGGHTVKTLKLDQRRTNLTQTYKFHCTLPRKTYKYWVYATDWGKNTQSSIGKNTLVVR